MSLLEEALRRHDRRGSSKVEMAPEAVTRAAAEDSTAVRTEKPPEDLRPPSKARLVAVAVPVALLLFFVALLVVLLEVRKPKVWHGGALASAADEVVAADAVGMTEEALTEEALTVAAKVVAEEWMAPAAPAVVADEASVSMTGGVAVVSVDEATEAATGGGADEAGVLAGGGGAGVEEPWPELSVKGIALGRERLVILSNGEMLSDGELSRSGVRVDRVGAERVWFSWRGRTNVLRRGDSTGSVFNE